MKITTNLIEKYTNNSFPQKKNMRTDNYSAGLLHLPPADIKGVSQINADLPVSYAKTGEISVPGLKKKASVYKLANGQKVVIQPKEGPVYIKTSFNAGALNEPDEKRGISHFIEHNLFNGSKNLQPGEYDKRVEELGGYTNAFTSFGETRYYLSLELLDDNSLEEAVKLNAYQTQFPVFPEGPLEREKEPVKSEIDMCSDSADNKAFSIMLKNMFNIKSDSDDIVIGTKENINKLTREDLFDYYNTWYTPDNAVTVITGDVDEQQAINLVSRYFNKKPDYSNIQKRIIPELKPVNKPSRTDFKQKNNPNAQIILGFPLEEGTSKEDKYKLSLLFSYIFSTDSEISKKLDKYGVRLDFGLERLSSKNDGAEAVTCEITIPDEYSEEVLKIIYDGLSDLYNNPPEQDDIARLANSLTLEINTNEDNDSISSNLLYMVNNNDLNYFEDCKNTIKSVTPREISDTAKKYLDLNKAVICIAHPENVSDEQIKNNYIKAQSLPKNISFGKSEIIQDRLKSFSDSVSRYQLSNNMQTAFIPVEGTPMAKMRIYLDSDVNKSVSYGASAVLTEMLNRGNAFYDNFTFSRIMGDLNSDIVISASSDNMLISSSFPADKAKDVIPIIKQTILNPNFSQEEFERAKKLVKENIQNSRKDPHSKITETLFPDDKYFASKEEQLKCLDNLTLQDIKNLYCGILNNSQALTTVASPAQNLVDVQSSVFNEFSSNLPLFKTFVPQKKSNFEVYKPNTKEKFITDTEENSQASIIQSYQYKASNSVNDTAKISILNRILGGGMSSRLFQDLRNNEKLAYHVASYNERYYNMGLMNLEIMTSTEAEEASSQNVIKAVNALKRNVQKLKTENVTEQELESAKKTLKTSILYKLNDSSTKNQSIMADIDNIYGLNYDNELLKAIDAVTADDVRACANYVFADPPINSVVAGKKTINEIFNMQNNA